LLHKIERAMSMRVQILTAACLFAGCNGPSVVQPLTEPGAAAEEAVSFRSGTVTLAGTIVRPAAATRSPAVVLFHGSGPQRRDLTTARWFAEQGILALAYDKRGVGESTGDYRPVPFTDLCDDGLAAIELLKRRSDVDANRIGVWGLSQGGWLGPLAASRSPDVKFVIAVSGPGVSPGEQMIGDHRSDFTREGPTRFHDQGVSTRGSHGSRRTARRKARPRAGLSRNHQPLAGGPRHQAGRCRANTQFKSAGSVNAHSHTL
jgi:dienelactone hydrolase